MGSSVTLEFLPADVVGLSPLARAALGGEVSVPGVRVARSVAEVPRPVDRFDADARAALAEGLEEAVGCISPPVAVLESIREARLVEI